MRDVRASSVLAVTNIPSSPYGQALMASRSTSLTGIVYIMHEERNLGLPSTSYLSILEEAYDRFGWDREIIETALAHSYIPGKTRMKKKPRKLAMCKLSTAK